MQTIFEMIDGKKTNIGAALAALSAILLGIGQIWGIEAEAYYRTVETITYVAGVLGGGGLLHKVVKAKR
jgi:hypothetical protein